jgi:hypothetical protein
MSKAMVTVKRYFLLVIGLCMAISVITSCELLEKPEAVFTIVNWSQEYLEGLGIWNYVVITYKVENTGNCDIDYYTVNFKVTCESGNVYAGSDLGTGLSEGGVVFDTAYVDTAGEKATDVIIQDHSVGKY